MASSRTTFGAPAYKGAAGTVPASQATTPARIAFLRKTYTLFSLALVLWMGTAAVVISNESLLKGIFNLFGGGWIGMLIFLFGAFALLRVTANRFPLNLLGLGLFAILMGVFTAPSVYIALAGSGVGVVIQAFVLTLTVFGGLTGYVLVSKKDFSFIRGGLSIGLGLAIGVSVLAMFGNSWGANIVLSTGYSMAMVVLFAGYMLYDTSNILRRYPTNMAASAAATLFLDFVIMFMHILRLLSGNRD